MTRILFVTGRGIFVFSIISRHIPGSAQPILSCLYRISFTGINQLNDSDHTPPYVKLKNVWNFTSIPSNFHGVVLKHRDNLYFHIYFVVFPAFEFYLKCIHAVLTEDSNFT
jgi:hypothetical protein